ncbi:hypothetical protein K7432_001145 [Basidiobolus ranarum]|uniref:RGS domain-containing protein n=1 Tax=Basidiobolus ranarum TaxID=34480 RepID=A0ABR2X3I2_9FUNG
MSLKTPIPRSPGKLCQMGFPPNVAQKNSSKPSCRYSALPSRHVLDIRNQEDIFCLNQFPRRTRRLRIQAARNQRAFEHIESYIRVIVFVSLNHYFPVTISRSSTVEELSKLIEAEYSFNYLCSPTPASSLDYVKESTQSLKQLLDKGLMEDLNDSELLGPEQIFEDDGEGNAKPLICGAIFSGKVELIFSDTIGNVLNENDIIRVVNIYEDMANTSDTHEILQDDTRRWSCPPEKFRPWDNILDEKRGSVALPRNCTINKKPHDSYGISELTSTLKNNSAEVKFQGIFQNKICLNYFRQFCLQEYALENFLFWVEVEVYRCTKSSLVPVIADYLYKVYISNDGPLRINIPDELRNAIPPSILSPEHLPNLSIFDEAQEYIFDLLVHNILPQFEASDLYVKLVQDRTIDGANFEEAYISESTTKWLQFDIGTVATVMDTISRYQENQLDMQSALQERDNILEQIMNQMFTPIPMSPYFTGSRHPNAEQNTKRIMMKKKLARLMGQRSAEKESIQQIIDELFPSSNTPSKSPECLPDDDFSWNMNHETMKKKKIEKLGKLEDFFGKRLSTNQLAHQNLVNSEEDFETRDSFESDGPAPLCPLTTYNDLSPEERRLLTKRTRKLKLLFGEPMDEQFVSKSLTNPIMAHKLNCDPNKDPADCYNSPVSESEKCEQDSDDQEFPSRLNSKEIKRKKLVKLHQLLGIYPSPNEIENGSSNVKRTESMIYRNAKTAPPEIRKLQVKRANKLEKVFGQHPPKEFIKVNKETEVPLQKRSSIVSYLLETENSVEDLMHYLELLSGIRDDQSSTGFGSTENNLDTFSEEEVSDDDGSLASDGVNKVNRQKKLSKLRRFFGNDLGLESLITQNILLRQQCVAENLYNTGEEEGELFGQHLNNLELDGNEVSEEYVRHAMKNDLDQLRREVQELHHLNSHNSSQNSFMKRVVRTASIPRSNTFRSLRSTSTLDNHNSVKSKWIGSK